MTEHIWTADDMREDYSWKQAWGCGGGEPHGYCDGTTAPCEGAACSSAPVGADDLVEVIAASEGENDGPAWLAVARLKDGRFAFVDAGCDYTGWDCQAGGSVTVSDSLANLWQFGLTTEARERLGEEPPAGSV